MQCDFFKLLYRQKDCKENKQKNYMTQPIKSPGEVPQNPAAQTEKTEREKNDRPQDDDTADITPRNIDPSDENSAEPDIIEETER